MTEAWVVRRRGLTLRLQFQNELAAHHAACQLAGNAERVELEHVVIGCPRRSIKVSNDPLAFVL